MNYIALVITLVLIVAGARFFSATKQFREPAPPHSAAEKIFTPPEDAAAKKMREMRENQQRLQSQQQKMQQERLNTYGTMGQ